MPSSVDDLSVADFMSSGWREIVMMATEKDCFIYWGLFSIKQGEAAEAGDEKLKNLFALLADLVSMFIDPNASAEPLRPISQIGDRRSAIPSDFAPAFAFLSGILTHVDDPELKARIADVIWLTKHDFKVAREAVTAYFAASANLDDEDEALVRIERAIAIAMQGNHKDLTDDAITLIEAQIAANDKSELTGEETSTLPARLMESLQRLRRRRKPDDVLNYVATYTAISSDFATVAETRCEWNTARRYFDVEADWHQMAKSETEAQAARLQSAEDYVLEAESRIAKAEPQCHMGAVYCVEKAIQALRSIGGQQERIDELHDRLIGYNRKAVKEMETISFDFDTSALVERATQGVSGRTLHDAIFALAFLYQPSRYADIRVQAEQSRNEIVFRRYASSRLVNAKGRTVARHEPPDGSETQDEADLRLEMYSVASRRHWLQGYAVIEPARTQILREHTVRVADLLQIVRNNPLVPAGREEFYARGLHAGFGGDFVTAIHLLVPQVENSVRHILETDGVITSKLGDGLIQDEHNLNTTLREDEFAIPLKKLLGEDMVFDLRCLLIERYGSNIRNSMAHGLLDYEVFSSGQCVYLWWLILRLCCTPILAALQNEVSSYAEEPAHNSKSSADEETDLSHD